MEVDETPARQPALGSRQLHVRDAPAVLTIIERYSCELEVGDSDFSRRDGRVILDIPGTRRGEDDAVALAAQTVAEEAGQTAYHWPPQPTAAVVLHPEI